VATPRSRLLGVDLNLLLALDALLEERNVTRAARRVGLSQSAMSHALARLRGVTGDQLLVRTARELVLTPRAAALRAPVADALARLEEALAEPRPFDPSAVRQEVRIAAIDLAQVTLVPRLVAALAREAPGVELMVQSYPEDVTRVLSAGECDLALGIERRLPQLRQELLLSDRFVCLVRRGHPCLAQRMTAARFAALEHVVVTPHALPRGAVDRALRTRRLKRRVVFAAPSFLSAALAVAESDHVLTSPELQARLAAGLTLASFEPPVRVPPVRLTVTWHARRQSDPLFDWLRRRLRELASQLQRRESIAATPAAAPAATRSKRS
jgi:DNA-binding transcriptional LysR family regulator